MPLYLLFLPSVQTVLTFLNPAQFVVVTRLHSHIVLAGTPVIVLHDGLASKSLDGLSDSFEGGIECIKRVQLPAQQRQSIDQLMNLE